MSEEQGDGPIVDARSKGIPAFRKFFDITYSQLYSGSHGMAVIDYFRTPSRGKHQS